MMDATRTILKGVQALFQDPAHHTTGEAAREADGTPCDYASESATCWCFIGAVGKVAHENGIDIFTKTIASVEIGRLIADLTGGKSDSMVGVNEFGIPIPDGNGRLVTGLDGILRICEVGLRQS